MRVLGAEDLRSSVRIGWTGWQAVGPVREEITRGLSWVVWTGRRLVREPSGHPASQKARRAELEQDLVTPCRACPAIERQETWISAPCHRRPHHSQGSVNPPLRSLQLLCKHTDANPRLERINKVTNYKTSGALAPAQSGLITLRNGPRTKKLLLLRRDVRSHKHMNADRRCRR